jgi:hypothetical protein
LQGKSHIPDFTITPGKLKHQSLDIRIGLKSELVCFAYYHVSILALVLQYSQGIMKKILTDVIKQYIEKTTEIGLTAERLISPT